MRRRQVHGKEGGRSHEGLQGELLLVVDDGRALKRQAI